MDIIPLKRCTQCGLEKPATPEYFYRCAKLKCGLKAYCKACDRVYDKHTAERTADYLKRNADRIAEYTREYQKRNAERLADYLRLYNRRNAEQIAQRKRDYNRRKPEVRLISGHRRRTRKLSLPVTFTDKHWQLCLEYWHGHCAVCGVQLRDLFGNIEPHADHWHPLNQPGCPGTTPDNMICLCNKCNLSKNDSLPVDWLHKRYSKRKAKPILDRIKAYFEWIEKQS